MSIELRSLNGINNAIQAINAGDYDDTTVLNVRLHHPYFVPASEADFKQQMEVMAQAAGKLSKLVSLSICPAVSSVSRCTDCTLHVTAVAAAIEQASSLETLVISNVLLTGTNEDFIKLSTAFQGHTKLKDFSLACKLRFLDGDSTSNDTSQNRVLTSLGSIPSLESVQLHGGYVIGDISLLSLTCLSQSKSLRIFRIITSALSDEGMAVVAAGLGNGAVENLNSLSLWGSRLGLKGCEGLVKLLSSPHSKLRDIYLRVDAIENMKLFQKLVDALGKSTCTTITFGIPSMNKEDVLASIKIMLPRNYRIKSLRVRLIRTGNLPWRDIDDHEIDFLVKANRLGRGSLFQRSNEDDKSAPSCSWMDLFEATENKLDNIFYLVRSHPNEFADMGLRDCAQKMPPTKGEIDTMFRRIKRDIRQSLAAQEPIDVDEITDEIGAVFESELCAHSSRMRGHFGEHKDELEQLYSNSEDRILAKVGEEMDKFQAKSEERMQAVLGNAFEEQKKELQKLHAPSDEHYSKSSGRAMVFSLWVLLALIFTGLTNQVYSTSSALGQALSYTFRDYNNNNIWIAIVCVQTIGIAWLLSLLCANKTEQTVLEELYAKPEIFMGMGKIFGTQKAAKTEGMLSVLQAVWDKLNAKSAIFMGKILGTQKDDDRTEGVLSAFQAVLDGLYSKYKSAIFVGQIFGEQKGETEKLETNDELVDQFDERMEAKHDSKLEECAEASTENADTKVANDENDKKDSMSASAAVTASNGFEATWSKSKKKRMRRLRAKQKKQSGPEDDKDGDKKGAPKPDNDGAATVTTHG